MRELAAHTTMAIEAVNKFIDRPAPPKQEVTLLDWPFVTAVNAEAIADTSREPAAGHPDLDAFLAVTEQRFTERLAAHPDTRLLLTGTGPMSLGDYLVTRTVELVVHTDDLNRSVPASTSRTTARPSPPAPGCSPTRWP